MAQKKKLQVFISSTFADLKEERQAAVEAILTAGHIPAGMELFTAGDESQMNVIKRWIDESDVYLLILAGRYGSIEPMTGKSYTHLEYEYAVEKQKPLFAVVIDEEYLERKLRKYGSEVIERDRQESLRNFRTYVLTKMVRFWSDPRDIKLAILETLSEFERRPELVGWISGSEAIDGGALAEELARLAKENAQLRAQLEVSTSSPATYNGLTFQQMYKLLTSTNVNAYGISGEVLRSLKRIADAFGDSKTSMLHFLWFISGLFQDWQSLTGTDPGIQKVIKRFTELGIVERTEGESNLVASSYYRLTPGSREFLVRMRVEFELAAAEAYILRTMEDLKAQPKELP